MPSVRKQIKGWIEANRKEENMTTETLSRLYDVMLEMEALVDNPNVKDVPVDKVDKWFQFLQFSIIKELTGKDNVVLVKEEEVQKLLEGRVEVERI